MNRRLPLCIMYAAAFFSIFLILLGSPLSAKSPTPEVLLTGLKKAFQQRNEEYTKARPAVAAPLEGADRVPALNHLRVLLEMEDLLRQLREDKEAQLKQMETGLLSGSEKDRLLDLRHDALVERAILIIDRPKRVSLRAQERLLKGYESKSKRSATKLTKAQNTINKLFARDRVDDDEVEKYTKLIKEAKKELLELQLAFLGASAALEGFEVPFASIAPGPVEDLLSLVISARDTVIKDLRASKAQRGKNNQGKTEAVISGITVRSENLGVILDNSSSMTPFLQPLRDEISKDFAEAHFRECYGCALNWSVSGSHDKRSQVVLFMEDLVIIEKVDAIYWFSDLRDPITPIALNRLSQLRSRGKTSLYVLSVGNKPTSELEPEIDSFLKHKGK